MCCSIWTHGHTVQYTPDTVAHMGPTNYDAQQRIQSNCPMWPVQGLGNSVTGTRIVGKICRPDQNQCDAALGSRAAGMVGLGPRRWRTGDPEQNSYESVESCRLRVAGSPLLALCLNPVQQAWALLPARTLGPQLAGVLANDRHASCRPSSFGWLPVDLAEADCRFW